MRADSGVAGLVGEVILILPPIAGAEGSLEQLAALPIERKIYIHINNTNPILLEDASERRIVEEHGLEVAADGLELEI